MNPCPTLNDDLMLGGTPSTSVGPLVVGRNEVHFLYRQDEDICSIHFTREKLEESVYFRLSTQLLCKTEYDLENRRH